MGQGSPSAAQAFRGPHHAGAFLLGHGRQCFGRVVRIARSGMGHHTGQCHAALVQELADLGQCGVFGLDAGAVVVGVHLDQHLETLALGLAKVHDGLGRGQAVGDELQRAASAAQGQGRRELACGDAHGVEDVGDAGLEKLARLLEGGHRDATGTGGQLLGHHHGTFAGLHMRTKGHALRLGTRLHAGDVVPHAGEVDHGGGGVDLFKRSGVHGDTVGSNCPVDTLCPP